MLLQRHPEISGVRMLEGRPFFPISWLHTQAYCEYQIYLQNFLGIKLKPNPSMLKGLQQHHKLYREFKEKATERGTIQELLEKVKRDGISYSSRELGVVGLVSGMYGKIDNVILHPDRIEIIDDKPSERVWSSDVGQGGLPSAQSDHFFHYHWRQSGPGLDSAAGEPGFGGGRQSAHRYAARVHPGRGRLLPGLDGRQFPGRGQGERVAAFGGAGIRGARRRRHPLSVLSTVRGVVSDNVDNALCEISLAERRLGP